MSALNGLENNDPVKMVKSGEHFNAGSLGTGVGPAVVIFVLKLFARIFRYLNFQLHLTGAFFQFVKIINIYRIELFDYLSMHYKLL